MSQHGNSEQDAPSTEERSVQPIAPETLSYANPAQTSSLIPKLPGSVKAVLLIVGAFLFGKFLLRFHGASILMIPVIVFGGVWYCLARILPGSSGRASAAGGALQRSARPLEVAELWLRNFRWRFWIAVGIAVLLGIEALTYGPPAYRQWRQRARQLQAQSLCMDFLEQPDQMIYSDDAQVRTAPIPAGFTGYNNGRGIAIARLEPGPWRQFVEMGPSATLAYLHRMKLPDGAERLVAIGFAGYSANDLYKDGTSDRILCLYESMYVPATASSDAAGVSIPQPGLSAYPHVFSRLEVRLADSDHITFFSGQPVSGDPAAFTIPYILNGRRGTIDGRLSGSMVQLVPREGTKTNSYQWIPATAPTTTGSK